MKANAFSSSGRDARHCCGARECHWGPGKQLAGCGMRGRPTTPGTALLPLAEQEAVGWERCQQPAAP